MGVSKRVKLGSTGPLCEGTPRGVMFESIGFGGMGVL